MMYRLFNHASDLVSLTRDDAVRNLVIIFTHTHGGISPVLDMKIEQAIEVHRGQHITIDHDKRQGRNVGWQQTQRPPCS
ncbi:hypothetical protein D3C79_982130 [compost metagenome]